MTQLLEKVLKRVSEMPAPQDEFASFMLAELESKERWDLLFACSQDTLSRLADQALAEFHAGDTEPFDLGRDFPKD